MKEDYAIDVIMGLLVRVFQLVYRPLLSFKTYYNLQWTTRGIQAKSFGFRNKRLKYGLTVI